MDGECALEAEDGDIGPSEMANVLHISIDGDVLLVAF